jgi:glyoxylase-like metal-dependent hydrolase (beta-lactamase superfamily II)
MFDHVEISAGVSRITFPMPMSPGHVHGYLLPVDDGFVLVDTGLGLPDLAERWQELLPALGRPIAAIVITHFHPDHVGGTADVAELTGAPVYQGALDYDQCEKVWGGDDWAPHIADWFHVHGASPEETAELLEAGSVYRPFVRFVRDPQLVREGDEVAGWRVGEFPGHADGHICLSKDGLMIAGDHLLPRITPAVGLYPESRPDPLGDYLASLERVVELGPRLALPGHGDPIADPAGRAREIVEHHRVRLDERLVNRRPDSQPPTAPGALERAHRRARDDRSPLGSYGIGQRLGETTETPWYGGKDRPLGVRGVGA